MDNQETSQASAEAILTQHAMLVVWGLYGQRIGLVDRLMQVHLKQKSRDHQPQTKVLEFFVAMLAGLPYLQDISRSAHPLDPVSYTHLVRTPQILLGDEPLAPVVQANLAQIGHAVFTSL